MLNRFAKLAAVFVLGGVGVVGAARQAGAAVAPVTLGLETFLPGGANADGFTFGDKRYSNFTVSSTGDVTLDATDVDLRFTEAGSTQTLAFLMDLGVSSGQRADLVLGYDVTVVDPARHIRNVRLRFDGAPTGTGGARSAASVTETVSTLDGSAVAPGGTGSTAQLTVFNDGPGPLADNLEATLAVNPATGLRFTKDLLLASRADGGGVGVSTMENSVTQDSGPAAVPLPPAALAALPLIGMLFGRKLIRSARAAR